MQWRYLDNPSHKYHFVSFEDGARTIGYIVYKPYTNETNQTSVDILEAQASDTTTLNSMLQWSRYHFLEKNNYVRLTAWSNVHDEQHLMFVKNSFVPSGKTTYMAAATFQEKTDWLDPKAWRINLGDSDVF